MTPIRNPTQHDLALAAIAAAITMTISAGEAGAANVGDARCQARSGSAVDAAWSTASPAPQTSTSTNQDPMNMQQSNNRHAEGLVRIGRQAIAQEDDASLDAYFAPDFVFHGPDGDLSYDQLKAYFASLRAAFTGLKVERAAIVGEGDQMASRTIFSGRFDHVFTQAPAGPVEPNGAEVTWEVINIFRYDQQGRLAEEWVQTDYRSFLEKLAAAPSQTR
jgi:predicted ester cyclase